MIGSTLFRNPSALRMAIRDLEDAQRHRLEAAKHREYYCAIEQMYADREQRLREEIQELNHPEPEVFQ
jgi:phage host-nuclease inhibitor protein Gam